SREPQGRLRCSAVSLHRELVRPTPAPWRLGLSLAGNFERSHQNENRGNRENHTSHPRVDHDLPTAGVCVACATPPVNNSAAQGHVCAATRLRRSNSNRLEGETAKPSTETGQARTPVLRAFIGTQVLSWGEMPGDRDIG